MPRASSRRLVGPTSVRRLVQLSFTCFALAAALVGISAPRAFALPPTLTVPGPLTSPELQPLTFTVTAADPEGQLCDLSASNLPAGATFTDNRNNTGSFAWTPDGFTAGSYDAFFTANDTFGGRVTRDVLITITDANGPPELNPIADRTLDPGSMAFIGVSAWDPEGDPLTLTQSGLPPFGALTDNGDGTGSIALLPSVSQAPGSWNATVFCSDGSNTVSQSFTVIVTGVVVAHPPILNPIGNQTAAEGATQSVTVSASDEDGGTLTWSVALPGFANLTPATSGSGSAAATLTFHPGFCDAGSYSARVGVSDGALVAQETFTVTVTDVPRPPAWSSGGAYAASLPEGGSTNVLVATTDPDAACGAAGAALRLVSSNAGLALTLQLTDNGDGSGSLAVAAGSHAAGSYQAALRATDSANSALTVDATVAVTVTHINLPPVASAGGPYTGLCGVAVSLSGANSSDPNGDALTYSWVFGDGGTGVGMSASHTYASAGSYPVTLSVSDGSLTGSDATTATVASQLEAHAWAEPHVIRFFRGRPTVRVYLEPVANSFDVRSVLVGSITLSSASAAGQGSTVQPLAGKVVLAERVDGRRTSRLRVEFSRDALRGLLSFVTKPSTVNLTLGASLATGGDVRATFPVDVVPEKKRSIRQVGPNPLNPEAIVTLDVSQPGPVRLRVYDMSGRLVRTLFDEEGTAGQTINVRFDGRGASGRPLASGHYILRAELADGVETTGVTILK
jgi:hypothetical protein